MDELLKDFLTESSEQLNAIGVQLARFEQDPTDARIVANIFRLVHAIKGGGGFLNLPRLERVAHFAEALVNRLMEGTTPNAETATLVLAAVERIKFILAAVSEGRGEPVVDDDQLVRALERAARGSRTSPMIALTDAASAFGPGPIPPERRANTVRVAREALERLNSLVCELVLTRNQIVEVAKAAACDEMQAPLRRLSAVAADLQSGVRAVRMLRVEKLFSDLRRLVLDLSAEQGKKVDLTFLGGETELDRELVEAVREPLMQVIRNAVDHGVEPPQVRLQLGKPEAGAIEVAAQRRAGIVKIEVADDGRGLDIDAIRKRAFASGLGSREELAALSETELCGLAFTPGPDAGRGIGDPSDRRRGLDIVRACIEEIGGSASLESRSGRGATVKLRIPLMLATLPALILKAGEERFALPRQFVEEILELGPGVDGIVTEGKGALILNTVEGEMPAGCLRALEQGQWPVAAPSEVFRIALKMRAGLRRFALVVDEIVDTQEIVLEPLPARLNHPPMFSAGAILGDGAFVRVLDAAGLASSLDLSIANAVHIDAIPTKPTRSEAAISPDGGVLVLEPARFVRTMIASALARRGYEPRAVGTLEEALVVVGAGRRLVAALVDLELAVAHRDEFARQIRFACGDPPPILIGLASHGGPAMQIRAQNVGMSAAVGKFDRASMLAALPAAFATRPTMEIAA